MIQLSPDILSELSKQNKYVIPVVEIYPRVTEDIVSLSAPGNAIGRFSNTCYTWNNSTGSYAYDAKVLSWPEVQSYLGKEVNTAEIELSNVTRGEDSTSRFVLDNKIKGCWMVIRLLYPDKPEESQVVFWGKCERPGGINNETINLTAKQDLGNFAQEIPFREYGVRCPLEFAKPMGGCLGDQTLAEKSISYQQAVAQFGSAGCNKLFGTCTLLENTKYFQGQRVVAVSGQFSYITIEEVVKRVLFWTKRKKIPVVKTDNWSSVNQSEGNEIIPVAFGRCQIQGHPFTWADQGQTVKSLLGFCEGKISAFNFVRSRTQGINIINKVEHLGDWGGVGTQQLDALYNGASGYNSRLAYLEIVTDGSSPTQVDDAPIITAVIRGLEIPVPDENGYYTVNDWSNNPVHVTRFILTDTRFGRIPTYRLDDETNLYTSFDCDELVEDRTNEEFIVLPANEVANYGVTYRRFRSAGRYSAYKDIWDNQMAGGDQRAFAQSPIDPPGENPPVARFTATPVAVVTGATVSFHDTSLGLPFDWFWDFGDGNTSIEQHPTHEYTVAGNYTVSLTVTNLYGDDTLIKPNYITVTGGSAGIPVANFTATPTYVAPATPVNFTDLSTNTPTSWAWDFGDGNTSTSQNPSNSYASIGNYTVTLVATNSSGSGVKTRNNYIIVSTDPYTGPVADFTVSPTVGSVPLTVHFSDDSTNSPDTWEWDFGDGTASTAQNPVHVYDTEGTYSVTLTVSNPGGTDSLTRNGVVAAVGAAPSLVAPPEFEDPEIRWFDPFAPYVLPPPRNVLRQKYTFNGAIQEKTSILDFLYERLLPTFKGYINYSPSGLIQIKNRQKADNAYVRAETRSSKLDIPITNVRPWKNNREGYLLIGTSLPTAEIREVTGFDYSTACNGFTIDAEYTGGVTAATGDIEGGTRSTPGLGYIELTGSPTPLTSTPSASLELLNPIDPGEDCPPNCGPGGGGGNGGGGTLAPRDEVKIIFGAGDNEFTISYISDGIEDLNTFTRMLVAFLNANIQFAESFSAYTLPNNPYKIWIRCEAGYLILDKALEYTHDVGEEVLRVQAIFENCGELTANTSARFDNIIENSFKWNEDEDEEVNAVVAKYTSAVDDFHLTNIMPRAGWDTIDLEGELVKAELDFTFIDNYWQAAYLTKGEAIDRIDGNLHFSFDTSLLAMRLELGDVVAIRHDSGDGALNYIPCWITKCNIALDEFTVNLGMKLYLSAAFDYDVQPIEPLLTTTLNAALYPQQPPETTGSNGGVSRSTEPVVYRPDTKYYEQFKNLGYFSPTGKDIV